MNRNGIKAIIFDYYGTLADLPDFARVRLFDALALSLGARLQTGEAFRDWRGLMPSDADVRYGGLERPPLSGPTPRFLTMRETWTERGPHLFRKWGVDYAGGVLADAYRDGHIEAPLFPEVQAVLQSLRRGYRLAVLSDADDDFLMANMERNGLAFEAIVTSEASRAYKPHVSLFREACRRLGVEPNEAMYVGDNPWPDVEGARHAGMAGVWINRDDGVWPSDLAQPTATVCSLNELLLIAG